MAWGVFVFMAITLAQIVDAIEDTLDAAAGLASSETYDELTEGIHDTPMLQVYPEAGNTDKGNENDRTTFGAVRRQAFYTVHADVYAQQRRHIGEDMSKLVDIINAIEVVLIAQIGKPYFGLAGIQSFRWRWNRVTFIYGDAQLPFVGARFAIDVWVF